MSTEKFNSDRGAKKVKLDLGCFSLGVRKWSTFSVLSLSNHICSPGFHSRLHNLGRMLRIFKGEQSGWWRNSSPCLDHHMRISWYFCWREEGWMWGRLGMRTLLRYLKDCLMEGGGLTCSVYLQRVEQGAVGGNCPEWNFSLMPGVERADWGGVGSLHWMSAGIG